MTRKRLHRALAIVATAVLIAFIGRQLRARGPAPLVSGKPVAYWLENLPPEAQAALLPADHPLAQAGPEIIPSLIDAIEKGYATRDFINRHRGQLPQFLHKCLPKQSTPGYEIRQVAAFRLGLFGPVASNAVPTLIELLKKPDTYVGNKGRVIQALGFIGPPAKQAVPFLVDGLRDQNQWIRQTAAYSLLQIGTVPPVAIPALRRNLGDTGYVAASMAAALWVAEHSPEALSRIRSMLIAKGDRNTRAHAAAALAFLSELPPELNPILARMMDEDDPSVRQGAALGLARPHAENLDRIIEVLVEGLRNGQFQIRCAEALGRIGPAAAVSKPSLEQATGYVLRIAAKDALAKVSIQSIEQTSPMNRSEASETQTSSAAGSRR